MGVYIALFIYLLLVRLFSSYVPKNNQRKFLAISSGIGLWLVLALRSAHCGVDLLAGEAIDVPSYYNVFHGMTNTSWNEIFAYYSGNGRLEFGWLLYNKLVSSVSDYFQFFLATTAAIQLLLIGYIIYKYSEDVQLSFIVYFTFGLYAMSFSGLRQSMAYAITFFATDSLLRNKKWLFVFLVLLASSIHKSALIFMVALPLSYVRLDNKRLIVSMIALVLMMPFVGEINSFLLGFLFPDRYQNYLGSGSSAINLLLLYIVLLLCALKVKTNSNINNLVRTMILCAVAGQSLGLIDAGATTRIAYYFSIYFLLLFPQIVSSFAPKNKNIISIVIASVLFLYFIYVTDGGVLNINPYYFCWEKGATYIY